MTDTVGREKRSEIMSRARSRDTRPELVVRRIAHRLGFRFRRHRNIRNLRLLVEPCWRLGPLPSSFTVTHELAMSIGA